ncbi:LPS export ABC transporter periplasmic protein LptC [Lacihabitans sp. LS3-19]|uniref:LPS export ABC transporter periplasmic protein LptC n=1 Tax=Lacihabitans sp. LS3-19 TaxID=2487335 RepID=UPI0020CF35B5|nr:LPS export ABC transporter periplasmic protein LptC [Lacihabitans sp. LS3-19]MCP9766837.1 LPS export ABC transporter periplasmic protein LptC [Lacihabitans sp. LS3-19]
MKKLGIFCFLLIIASPALWSCEEEKDKKEFIEYMGPILSTDNLSITYSDSGRVKVKMSTAKQMKFKNENELYPKAVYVNFLDKNGVEYSMLRGDSGQYSKEKNLYIIQGNVFFNNRLLQQSLSTEELFWNPVTKKIFTDKKVTIKTPRESITASGGMEASEDFSKYSLRKPKGTFMVDSLRTIVDTTGQD